MPTAVLFNGGVFKSGPIRNRVLELLASWNQGQAVRELRGIELDLAVAKGASFYGRTRVTGKGPPTNGQAKKERGGNPERHCVMQCLQGRIAPCSLCQGRAGSAGAAAFASASLTAAAPGALPEAGRGEGMVVPIEQRDN